MSAGVTALTPDQAGQHGHRAHATHEMIRVNVGRARRLIGVFRVVPEPLQPGQGMRARTVTDPMRPRPLGTGHVAREGHELWIQFSEPLAPEPQAIHHPGCVVLDEDVGLPNQFLHDLETPGLFEVDPQSALASTR